MRGIYHLGVVNTNEPSDMREAAVGGEDPTQKLTPKKGTRA